MLSFLFFLEFERKRYFRFRISLFKSPGRHFIANSLVKFLIFGIRGLYFYPRNFAFRIYSEFHKDLNLNRRIGMLQVLDIL